MFDACIIYIRESDDMSLSKRQKITKSIICVFLVFDTISMAWSGNEVKEQIYILGPVNFVIFGLALGKKDLNIPQSTLQICVIFLCD